MRSITRVPSLAQPLVLLLREGDTHGLAFDLARPLVAGAAGPGAAVLDVALADPGGAALYNWYKNGELRAEGTSITEGIGQGRVTANLQGVIVDDAFRIEDRDWLPVLYNLIQEEGLSLGGSSALNVLGAVQLAKQLGPGKTIVTVLCDGGDRYRSRLYDGDWLAGRGLQQPQRAAGELA